jgi:hypothetical protein
MTKVAGEVAMAKPAMPAETTVAKVGRRSWQRKCGERACRC